ncbi:hypothetical protein L249_5257 [Ophiocordyceps polyrhachis-furcata BCC 54312]|uniref:Uncharacterized protein n=1 Tax=Ophiocordyceps polyrhachis-furcata BCC 54312 TaxID=1330021 RepID=A0A367L9C8_9HYPO|nr:hypothetical protein L249_5257 [Ophiocordyceps polyrhachis-furcata BCC 54312]
MAFVLDSDDAIGYIGTKYCFEMEFLVAKEREGYSYSDEDAASDSGSDVSSLFQLRWNCPVDEEDSLKEVLYQCSLVFSKNNESVEIIEDSDPALALPWDSLQSESWILQPARFAVARPGCPEQYDWIGVRLRSPLFFETELTSPTSTVKWCIGALRMALRLHVNSTCPFDVLVRTSRMALDHVKKVATIVWLLERDMMQYLRPDVADDTPGRMKLVTTHAVAATRPLEGVGDSRPQDPDLWAAMERHTPRLLDDAKQEQLQRLWACVGLGELSEVLRSSDGQPLAFSLYPCPNDEGGEPASACILAFRYALWHPYDDVDVTNFWIKLALTLCRVMVVSSGQFKRSNRRTDQIVEDFDGRDMGGGERWKILAERLSLDADWSWEWDMIVQQYLPGRRLSRAVLDGQPPLGQIPELHMYRSR